MPITALSHNRNRISDRSGVIRFNSYCYERILFIRSVTVTQRHLLQYVEYFTCLINFKVVFINSSDCLYVLVNLEIPMK